ncbi:Zn2/Cys6 DNA-binding protein [Glarea lozoyensis ATCC 20868]|uniref:Zn2/Cys6 DNA-binding protein n=1 Tax=Glarea lozoyensis (strain ATCC 20868 / MF5171) TaxID=1116229 RepID=S3CYG2_GLAL2|nr:Zn2/Cys6 DNA-binding protein [Glarea lozoyensis ATCC 20868]EPE31307.1 Zn2/Cys6 DNA-binding protein [Glarea lozoyensis ATCC 20868]
MDSPEFSPEPFEEDDVDSKKPGESSTAKKPRTKALGRTRTKSGCLTCRKRRIKCGEERPTCHNCTKSKRKCEGYIKQVVFKDPINTYKPPVSSAATLAAKAHQSAARRNAQPQELTIIQTPLTAIPKSSSGKASKQSAKSTATSSRIVSDSVPKRSGSYQQPFQNSASRDNFADGGPSFASHEVSADTVDRSHVPEPGYHQFKKDPTGLRQSASPIKQEPGGRSTRNPIQTSPEHQHSVFGASLTGQQSFQDHNDRFPASSLSNFYPPYQSTEWVAAQDSRSASSSAPSPAQAQDLSSPRGGSVDQSRSSEERMLAGAVWAMRDKQRDATMYSNYQPDDHIAPQSSIQVYSQDEDMEDDDEDPWDVSDDDTSVTGYDEYGREEHHNRHLRDNDLGAQVVFALKSGQSFQDVHPRSIMDFIDRPNMLATYVPSFQATPLSDPITARIFCHFVNVTGPCMSMFERHPANPSLIFQGRPIPASQQHIWTYTFPTLALQNSALLHAMLALASLHIAKLQDGPVTASLKHYAIGLRRVGKLINLPNRQKEPATLAAALLLAFYECWCADHQKWSNHILGARQLLRVIDFAGMSRYIKEAKRQREREQNMYYRQQQALGHNPYDSRFQQPANLGEINEDIVGRLMGTSIPYNDYSRVMDSNSQDDTSNYSQKELDDYEIQRDLYWWYCKQDAYQGVLGGGRLFMDYRLWAFCPPRAPIGRLNATYGTYDHLMLLFGRLASFAAKDAKRKRLAIKANGGWRPPPGMSGSGDQTSQQGPPPSQRGPPPQGPGFPGMVPGVTEAQLPMGFSQSTGHNSGSSSPHSSGSEEVDLGQQLHDALEEWQDIINAFSLLSSHFGEDFAALGPEFSAPIQTPFGPALQYRTYGIAGIWMNFYMALIACHRAHPSMPPAAMMAAGIAARETAQYANELGRIAAGIYPDMETATAVNPGVGAALIESATPLFISGVQYQSPAQRAYIITHLHTVARLTGWQTALAIANGCETCWIKTAEIGRGPPYTRLEDQIPHLATPARPFPPQSAVRLSSFTPQMPGEKDTTAGLSAGGRGNTDIWNTGRRIDRAFLGKSELERRGLLKEGGRVHYALGVLGVESDFEGLGLEDGGGGEGGR